MLGLGYIPYVKGTVVSDYFSCKMIITDNEKKKLKKLKRSQYKKK
jgi:hypothetical protein